MRNLTSFPALWPERLMHPWGFHQTWEGQVYLWFAYGAFSATNCRNQKSVLQTNADAWWRQNICWGLLSTAGNSCLTVCGPAPSGGARQYGRSWAYSCHHMTTEFAFLFWRCGTANRITPVYLFDLSQHGPSWSLEKPFQRVSFFLNTACGLLSLTFLGKLHTSQSSNGARMDTELELLSQNWQHLYYILE